MRETVLCQTLEVETHSFEKECLQARLPQIQHCQQKYADAVSHVQGQVDNLQVGLVGAQELEREPQ